MSNRQIHVQIASKHKLVRIGTTQLRCFQPVAYLSESGFKTTLSQFYRSIPIPGDILILHRIQMDRFTGKYIKYARSHGVIVVYDTDDLIFSNDGSEYLEKISRKGYSIALGTNPYREAMELCDVVLVSVPYLAIQARKFHPDVRVIRNALSREYLEIANNVYGKNQKKTENEELTLAYLSGSSSHDNDFKLVEPALADILSRFNEVRLLIVGPLRYSKNFLHFGDRFTHLERVPYSEFPNLFERIDINLIPLEVDQPFCQSKSELKYIEAGACGVPSVASPTDVCMEVINDKDNGILVRNNDWLSPLEFLIQNPEKRKSMGHAARSHVLQHYAPDVRARDWEETLNNILIKNDKCRKLQLNFLEKYILRFSLEYMRGLREIKIKGSVWRKTASILNKPEISG